MSPLVMVGAVLAALAVLAVAVGLVLVASQVRARRAQVAAELAASRAQVEALALQVGRLSAEVSAAQSQAARAVAESRQRGYVITTLADFERDTDALPSPLAKPPVSAVIQDQFVGMLAHQQDTPLRARAVKAAVKGVAFGHGVRRALQPDVIDRALAESHVAKRRSRRNRKRELREARRLLRAVHSHEKSQAAAQRTADKATEAKGYRAAAGDAA